MLFRSLGVQGSPGDELDDRRRLGLAALEDVDPRQRYVATPVAGWGAAAAAAAWVRR